MLKTHTINNVLKEDNYIIEMHHNFKEKLIIAETVLKTLGIKYQIKAPKTHTTSLLQSLLRKSLGEINDDLADLEYSGDDYNHGSN